MSLLSFVGRKRFRGMKIYLTDDHAILLGGLIKILSTEDDLEVVGSAGSVQKTLEDLTQKNVDLLITDYNLPDDDGLTLVRRVKQKYPTVAILGDSFSVKVSSTSYPMDDNKFFYVQYQYQGEAINKKLANKEDNLIISVDEFFAIDGKAIPSEEVSDIKLFYYNAESQESMMMTSVIFSVVSNEDLKSISEQMEGDMDGMLEVINSLYGKCFQPYLEEALKD